MSTPRIPRRGAVRALLVATLVAGGVLSGSAATAAPVTIQLCAAPGTATLVGATTAPIWGFAVPTTPGDCSTATPTMPGPLLSVNEGDVVTITVTNALPAATAPLHTLRFEIPGVTLDPGPTQATPWASVTVTFTASAPGTYLYQSSGDGGRQLAMGLAGMLVVRPSAGQAYDSPTSAYDVEAPLVLGAVDPAFNAAPDSFDLVAYRATYWLINGKAYPDTAPIIGGAAGRRVLFRYANAGFDNTSMVLLGAHQTVIARSARLLTNPVLADAEIIPAGATEDSIVTMPATAPPTGSGFPLYNRQLHLTNGAQTAVPAGPPVPAGGMLTFLHG